MARRVADRTRVVHTRPAQALADLAFSVAAVAAGHPMDRDGMCAACGWTFPCPTRLPTLSTRPARQLILMTTAGTDASAYFRRYVELGRAGGANVGYLEFSADADADPTDPATWRAVAR